MGKSHYLLWLSELRHARQAHAGPTDQELVHIALAMVLCIIIGVPGEHLFLALDRCTPLRFFFGRSALRFASSGGGFECFRKEAPLASVTAQDEQVLL